MWCMARVRTCSSAARWTSRVRSSGPLPRSKGVAPSRASSASSAPGRSSGGVSDRSCRGRSTGRGAWTCWRAWPSCSAKVVRSGSWRATRASRAVRRAASSRGPRRRSTKKVRYSVLSGSKVSRNHRRCWANDSGSAAARSAAGIVSSGARCAAAGSGRAAARAATVGWVNSRRGEISAPRTARSREVTRMARIESPPRAKKLSVTPMSPVSPMSRTSAHTRATRRSASVRGAVRSSPAANPSGPGAGRARWSSLPLTVSGSASRGT